MFSDGYKFDFVISYASEDEEYAALLHTALGEAKVFFAPEFQAEIWGKNLYEYLYDIYSRKGRFCLLLISRHYVAKKWTRHEWRSAQERILENVGTDYILPIRLDESELPGLLSTVAYLDAGSSSIETIADLALKRLRLENGGTSITSAVNQKFYYTDARTTEKHIMELLETNKSLRLKVSLREMVSDFFSFISQLNKPNSETIFQTKDHHLAPILESLVTIGAVASEDNQSGLFSEVIGAFRDIFIRINKTNFPPLPDKSQHFSSSWVWQEIIIRVYGLGALLISRKRFNLIPIAIRQEIIWDVYYQKLFWSRYTTIILSREGWVNSTILCRLTIECIQSNEYLSSLFPQGADEIISTVCQFDFLQGIHVLHEGKDPSPNFGIYYNYRTEPIISELVRNPLAREAIPQMTDLELATIIEKLDTLTAQRLFVEGAWDRNGWEDRAVRDFLANHRLHN